MCCHPFGKGTRCVRPRLPALAQDMQARIAAREANRNELLSGDEVLPGDGLARRPTQAVMDGLPFVGVRWERDDDLVEPLAIEPMKDGVELGGIARHVRGHGLDEKVFMLQ